MRNQGVVITNIVFMVMAFSLGTSSYFLWNDVSTKKQQVATADRELSAAQSENSTMKSDFSKLRTQLGYEDVEDVEKLEEEMRSDIEKALGRPLSNTTYRDAVVTLGANLRRKTKEYEDNYQYQLAEAERSKTAEETKTSDQLDTYNKLEDRVASEHSQFIAGVQANHDSLEGSYNEQKQELQQLNERTKQAIDVARQEAVDFRETKDALGAINKELASQVDALSNASYERADAQIVYADQFLKLVRLNVGEADSVRPLTIFNVFPPNVLDIGAEDSIAKGTVQVVRSIGPHLCEAKILEDQMSDPILSGDLVYTPLWRPGETVKYALDFRLDINGDGRSDLAKIMTLINTSGGEVVAYMGDDGKAVRENEIGPDVYRLVTSERSVSDVLERDYSLDEASKEQIEKNVQQFRTKLRDNGVASVTLSEFLKEIGYKETYRTIRYPSSDRSGTGLVTDETYVELQESGVGRQVVSPGVVSPMYIDGASPAPQSPGVVSPKYDESRKGVPTSPGVTAPTYNKGAANAPKSPGVNSGYYTRKRPDKETN